jgi:hypothetical protein
MRFIGIRRRLHEWRCQEHFVEYCSTHLIEAVSSNARTVQEAKIFGRESMWKQLVSGANEASHVAILEIAGELIVASYLKRAKDPAFSEER